MDKIRDQANPQPGAGTYPTPNADGADGADPTQTSEAQAPLTDAARNAIHDRNQQTIEDARQEAFQADFLKKYEEVPGFGSLETDEAKALKGAFVAQGVSLPTAQQVKFVNAKVAGNAAFKEMVGAVTKGLNGEAAPPSSQAWTGMLTKVLTTAGLGVSSAAAVGAAATGAAASGQAASLNNLAATPAGTDPASASDSTASGTGAAPVEGADGAEDTGEGGLPRTSAGNVSALVLLVILQAQQETKKEKQDTLQKIKMYNGMLDELNTMVSSNLIPAQKQLEDMQNKNPKKTNLQVTVNWPTNLDTKNASMNTATGGVVLNAEWGNATTPSRQLVDSQGLSNLIQQADQWRTSIQNNQQQQSNRFQAQDNNMSSAWNILNAVLKNHNDAVSANVRNLH